MNEEKFTGKAGLYRTFRPSYPAELIDYLYSHIGFSSDCSIADIGAGTGIFTRILLERGSKVYAVEPNGDMREAAIKDLSGYENFVPVGASAENTGLDDSGVDFVTVAQAFHYFDRQLFRRECQRILKSGGKAVLVWNEADKNEAIIRKGDEIIEKYRVHDKSCHQRSGNLDDYSDFFADGAYERRIFRNDLRESREQFIGGHLSASYAPREDKEPEKYRGFVQELNALFDEYAANDILRFPQITKCYAGVMKTIC